jgi:hypothetical protein
MKWTQRLTAAFLILASATTNVWAQGASRKYGELLKRLPESANVLLLVDADSLFKSPLGQREKWQARAADRPTGVLGVSGDASKLAVAMGVDLLTLEERWKLGMLEARVNPPKLSVLAAREGGYVEQIQLQNVAWTPRNYYLFTFPERIIGFAAPSDRQLLSSWLLKTIIKPRVFPPGWADRAIYRADAGSQIVLAVDLTGAIAPKHVEGWIKELDDPAIRKMITSPELLASSLASAKSAFLQIDVKETIQGTLRVEFESSIEPFKSIVKALILQTLDGYGAQIDEIKRWDATVDSKSVSFTGRLSEDAVRRILSVVSAPRLTQGNDSYADAPPSDAAATAPQAPVEPSKDVALKASQGYFRAVTDIAETLMKHKSETQSSLKLWYDRSAKQIEELPLLNIDSDLLDWGSKIARTLREMAAGINYAVKDQTYRIAGTPNGYYGGYGYGYAGGNSKGYSASVIKKQYNSVLSVELDTRWQVMETSISDMRRKMVEKYKVDF